MPDGAAYFCSRGSVLGQVPGEVVAAAFGVFNPAVVVPMVAMGWALVTADVICAAPATNGTNVRTIGTNRPRTIAFPPYCSKKAWARSRYSLFSSRCDV